MKTLIISPHPDDETLGAGGAILNRVSKKNNSVYWLILTHMQKPEYDNIQINKRDKQIKIIKKFFKFKKIFNLGYKPGSLDVVPKTKLVKEISNVIYSIKPQEIFIPHANDVHSDHQILSKIISTCTKSFRFDFIRKIFSYETLSETNFILKKKDRFTPNYYEDITKQLNKKLKALKVYKSEIKKFPFPRSLKAVEALARLRGSEINTKAAEAFDLLKLIKK